jgi:hypothetical protein
MVTTTATPLRPVEQKATASSRPLLMLDPLLLLAALGLVACSLLTLHVATRGSAAGPSY